MGPVNTKSLTLPGLDIRTELKGVFFVFFRSQFGCFHFSVFRLGNVVLVHLGGKNLFWSNLVPAGFEPGTFGVTARNVTVLTNGLRLQVCALFLQAKYWSLRDPNLGPSGIEPGTFGVTVTNVTVLTNGPRLQVCVIFLQVKYWSLRDSNLGPSGIEPGTFAVTATNVTVSKIGPRW